MKKTILLFAIGLLFSVMAAAQTPGANGTTGGYPTGYIRSDGLTAVLYVGNDNHIYQQTLSAGSTTWSRPFDILGAASGAALSSSRAYGVVAVSGSNTVIYQGNDQHIHSLTNQGGTSVWVADDLNSAAHGSGTLPAAGSMPMIFNGVQQATGGVKDTWVVYWGSNNHLYGLDSASGYHPVDLTQQAATSGNLNVQTVLVGSDVFGYLKSDGVTNGIVYVAGGNQAGAQRHIVEISVQATASSPSLLDITNASGAPVLFQTSSQNPMAFASNGVNRIVCNSGIATQLLYQPATGRWSTETFADANLDDPIGYRRSDGYTSILYVGRGNNAVGLDIYEYFLASGASEIGGWAGPGDLTTQPVPSAQPPAGRGFPFVHADGTNGVVYLGADNHIREIYLTSAGWKTDDLTVAPSTLTITPATLPAGYESTNYSQQLTAAGGSGPYAWSVASGTLPPALTLSSGGLISGLPLAFGTFNFTVQAKDANGVTAQMPYSLVLNLPQLTVSGTITDPAGVCSAGVTLSLGVSATSSGALTQSGPTGTYTFPNVNPGSYVIVPSEPACTFTPPSLNVTIGSLSSTGNNFAGTSGTASWTVTQTHTGSFSAAQPVALFAVTVMNTNSNPTSGVVTVTEIQPSNVTAFTMSGANWVCSGNTCTRSDSLVSSGSYPPITVVVTLAADSSTQVTNQVNVTGGGLAQASANDTANIIPAFMDVLPTDVYLPAIDLLRESGITTGCSPTTYCGDANITQAQMAVFVVRSVMGNDNFTFTPTPYFSDVPATNLYFKWVQKEQDLGIALDCGPSQFCPDTPVTRGQMAVLIVRGRYGLPVPPNFPTVPAFTDVPTTNLYFAWIQKMKQVGITTGCSATTYCPDTPVTRAQMAVFIMRGMFNLVLPGGLTPLLSVSLTTIAQGDSQGFRIQSQNTNFVDGVTQVSAGPGLAVSSVQVLNATTLTGQIVASNQAIVGPRSIVVTTGSEEATSPNTLIVTLPQ